MSRDRGRAGRHRGDQHFENIPTSQAEENAWAADEILSYGALTGVYVQLCRLRNSSLYINRLLRQAERSTSDMERHRLRWHCIQTSADMVADVERLQEFFFGHWANRHRLAR